VAHASAGEGTGAELRACAGLLLRAKVLGSWVGGHVVRGWPRLLAHAGRGGGLGRGRGKGGESA